MGSRERRAHRQQQKQQAFSQTGVSERRVSLPAPVTMNTRDDPTTLPANHAPLLEDMMPDDGGLRIVKRPINRTRLASTSSEPIVGPFISYYGSGSASAEFWIVANLGFNKLNNGSLIASSASAVQTGPGGFNVAAGGSWVEFRKTIIYVTNTGSPNSSSYWTRDVSTSAWRAWSCSISGSASAGQMFGIAKFKNRLFTWPKDDSVVYYGSTDQFLGTFNPFNLGGVLSGSLLMTVTMTRDGGSGPDDYICFISESGDVAVYAGTDPGDATAWSLVGVYKIGRPLSRDAYITYGQQTVILCEDDLYFLPDDLVGKRNATIAKGFRQIDDNLNVTTAVYNPKEGKIVFSDGSVFDPQRGWAYSTITLTSAQPHVLREDEQLRAALGEFHGKTYVAAPYDPDGSSSAELIWTREMFPREVSDSRCRIRTAPIQTTGRTNISLVTPVFDFKPAISTSTDLNLELRYGMAVDYDNYAQPFASASAAILTTSSANEHTKDAWQSGFGTGDYAQVYLQVTNATSDADIYLYKFNATVSDTGGL